MTKAGVISCFLFAVLVLSAPVLVATRTHKQAVTVLEDEAAAESVSDNQNKVISKKNMRKKMLAGSKKNKKILVEQKILPKTLKAELPTSGSVLLRPSLSMALVTHYFLPSIQQAGNSPTNVDEQDVSDQQIANAAPPPEPKQINVPTRSTVKFTKTVSSAVGKSAHHVAVAMGETGQASGTAMQKDDVSEAPDPSAENRNIDQKKTTHVDVQLLQQHAKILARIQVKQVEDTPGEITVIWQAPAPCADSRYTLQYTYTLFHTNAYRTLAPPETSSSDNICAGVWRAKIVDRYNHELAMASLVVTRSGENNDV